MSDEFLIQQVLSSYTEGASRKNWDQVIATYAPDGVWLIPSRGARFEGHAAIREGLTSFTQPFAYVIQINSPALIKVEGDKATARSMIRECAKFADREEAFEALGVYTDKLVRTAEGWKFAERVFEALAIHRSSLLPLA